MMISIITTFYNDAGTLKRALDSVVAQNTTVNYEYIIVNDLGGDGSKWVFDGWYKSQPSYIRKRIKLVTPDKNLGCGGARLFGIEHAKGDYFMFLDADDFYLNKNFIQTAYNTIVNNGADIACFGARYYYGPKPNEYKDFSNPETVVINGEEAFNKLWLTNDVRFNVWDKIWSRKVVESYKYSTERRFEDLRTVPHWFLNASKVVLSTGIYVYYAYNPNSIIRKDADLTRIDTVKGCLDLIKEFKCDTVKQKTIYKRTLQDIHATISTKDIDNVYSNTMLELNKQILNEII